MNRKEMRRIYLCIISSTLIAISCTLILTFVFVYTNQAFAKCPNGTPITPSGDCQVVIAHNGLQMCPNGFHKSPGGVCEQVVSKRFNGNGSSNTSANTAQDPLIRGANGNKKISSIFVNSTNATNMMAQPLNASQFTTLPLAINHTLDQQCDSPGRPSCYHIGFKVGRANPGTSCPTGYSFAFCQGYEIGSGGSILESGRTDVGTAISIYLYNFPHAIMPKPPNIITTISGKIEPGASNATSVTNNTTKGTKPQSAIH